MLDHIIENTLSYLTIKNKNHLLLLDDYIRLYTYFAIFLEFMPSIMFLATKIDNKNTKTQLLRTREARNKELPALLQPNSKQQGITKRLTTPNNIQCS